jgi:predicted N-acyltransferase
MSERIRTLTSLKHISAATWDALANPIEQPYNPFVSHAFLSSLEDSGSATQKSGWAAAHLLLEVNETPIGLVPCYLKNHSMGEYVFDHGWADAFHRAGGQYYPKLQCSIPFTPATGPRLLATKENQPKLLAGLQAVTSQLQASSAHITFAPQETWEAANSSWLKRQDIQFHWHNQNFQTFADFLASLSSNKRKNIRKERAAVVERGISFELLSGKDLTENHWDHFYAFYMDTGSRKWGSPYLTRAFFSLITERMADHILLILAKRDNKIIAGALNFIGSETLYGRNWGCVEDHPFLHFETCYYQAIDFAISKGLKVVEAGAQGEHKLARGYLPVKTHSLHYFAHKGLARAVGEYLEHERAAIDENQQELAAHSPFKHVEPE